jgi:hypothetical protein
MVKQTLRKNSRACLWERARIPKVECRSLGDSSGNDHKSKRAIFFDAIELWSGSDNSFASSCFYGRNKNCSYSKSTLLIKSSEDIPIKLQIPEPRLRNKLLLQEKTPRSPATGDYPASGTP